MRVERQSGLAVALGVHRTRFAYSVRGVEGVRVFGTGETSALRPSFSRLAFKKLIRDSEIYNGR